MNIQESLQAALNLLKEEKSEEALAQVPEIALYEAPREYFLTRGICLLRLLRAAEAREALLKELSCYPDNGTAHDMYNLALDLLNFQTDFAREVDLLNELSSGRGSVIDVGSNAGDFSKAFLKRGFRVLSIEPVQRLTERQKQRLAREISAGALMILRAACSDRAGEAQIFLSDGEDASISSLEPYLYNHLLAGEFSGRSSEIVPCLKLSEVITQNSGFLGSTPCLKISAEGHELKVLRGLFPCSGDLRPRVIVARFITHPWFLAQLREVLRLLLENEYHQFKFLFRSGKHVLHETEWLKEKDLLGFNFSAAAIQLGRIAPGLRFGSLFAIP